MYRVVDIGRVVEKYEEGGKKKGRAGKEVGEDDEDEYTKSN